MIQGWKYPLKQSNANMCHNPPGPGGGQFCEGGGLGSGAGGSYTPYAPKGMVGAGTFPAHDTKEVSDAKASLAAIEAQAKEERALAEKLGLTQKKEPSLPAPEGQMEKNPNWKAAIQSHTYTESKKGQYGKFEIKKEPTVWRKGSKERVYVPRNEYEQAGYITKDANDISGRNSGEHRNWYYSATRPGNVGDLTSLIDNFERYGIK